MTQIYFGSSSSWPEYSSDCIQVVIIWIWSNSGWPEPKLVVCLAYISACSLPKICRQNLCYSKILLQLHLSQKQCNFSIALSRNVYLRWAQNPIRGWEVLYHIIQDIGIVTWEVISWDVITKQECESSYNSVDGILLSTRCMHMIMFLRLTIKPCRGAVNTLYCGWLMRAQC